MKKIIVISVIALFIVVGFQPAFATEPIVSTDISKEEIEPDDYLFQTIIDIANNPEVKNLLEHYKFDFFKVDIDKSVYRKLLIRDPRLMFNTLFSKSSLSVEYLDKCYNNGIEITDILGEEKVLEIIENVEITDTKLFDEIKDIILKDEEISNRIAILNEMNKYNDPDTPWEYPVICAILLLIYFPLILVCDIFAFAWLSVLYSGNLLLIIIFGLCLVPLWIFFMVNVILQELFLCWP